MQLLEMNSHPVFSFAVVIVRELSGRDVLGNEPKLNQSFEIPKMTAAMKGSSKLRMNKNIILNHTLVIDKFTQKYKLLVPHLLPENFGVPSRPLILADPRLSLAAPPRPDKYLGGMNSSGTVEIICGVNQAGFVSDHVPQFNNVHSFTLGAMLFQHVGLSENTIIRLLSSSLSRKKLQDFCQPVRVLQNVFLYSGSIRLKMKYVNRAVHSATDTVTNFHSLSASILFSSLQCSTYRYVAPKTLH